MVLISIPHIITPQKNRPPSFVEPWRPVNKYSTFTPLLWDKAIIIHLPYFGFGICYYKLIKQLW